MIYHWETARAEQVYMTQPLHNGQTVDYTWRRAVGEARRMATYLKSLNLPEKSRIGIVSKNCAHWIMSDWAIWMAGHISVPLYPTLNADTVSYIVEHAEIPVMFVGKLDDDSALNPPVLLGMLEHMTCKERLFVGSINWALETLRTATLLSDEPSLTMCFVD